MLSPTVQAAVTLTAPARVGAQCWSTELVLRQTPSAAPLADERVWARWYVLLPTALSLLGLLLVLVAWLVQKRRARSFRSLFEEHLIQTANSRKNQLA